MSISFKQNCSPTDVALRLKACAERARNLRPVLVPASIAIKSLIIDSFAKSATPEGIKWKPLAASTLRYKHGNTIGIETGRLLGSVYAMPEGNNSIRWGASAQYAKFFNSGTLFQPGRAFMPYGKGGNSKILFNQISRWIGLYISKGIKP